MRQRPEDKICWEKTCSWGLRAERSRAGKSGASGGRMHMQARRGQMQRGCIRRQNHLAAGQAGKRLEFSNQEKERLGAGALLHYWTSVMWKQELHSIHRTNQNHPGEAQRNTSKVGVRKTAGRGGFQKEGDAFWGSEVQLQRTPGEPEQR